MNLRTKPFLIVAAVGAFAYGGCQSSNSSVIQVVRDGVLPGHDSTTVGKAFEGTLQNPKWSSFETAKGANIVEFKGTMKLSTFMDTFGWSPACQKQLNELHDNCVISEHLNESIAATAKSNKERSEAFDQSMADLTAQRNALVPASNANARDREVRMIEWCHQGGIEADCNQFARSFSFATPESEQHFYALTDQINEAKRRYQEQNELAAKQRDETQAAIAKCVTVRRGETVTPVGFQFTLSADKQSFAITSTDVGNSLPNILTAIYH